MSDYGPEAPVQVFQHEAEFSELLELYRERAPRRVLEIGTYFGGTLYHWLQNAKPGTLIVALDSYKVGVDNRYLYPGWTPEDVTLEVVKGDSRDPDVVKAVNGFGPFDWVFIDAGHYYDEVKDDWENYGLACEPGGVVALHDILDDKFHHPEIEVAELWAEIKQSGYPTREIVHDREAWWGGIGVVYK